MYLRAAMPVLPCAFGSKAPKARKSRSIGVGFGMLKKKSKAQSVESVDILPKIEDHLLQLISLQKASGCWDMDGTLAQVFGRTKEEVVKQTPAQVEKGVWATVLALIWLHGFKMNDQVEWQFVAIKAAAWIRDQKVANLSECVHVGNALLGCQVKEEALGL